MSNKYMEIDFEAGATIKECVDELLFFNSKGKKVFGTFNGVVLYSDTVTLDSAYKDITGLTKSEFEMKHKREIEEYEKEEEEYKKNIPVQTEYWINEGKKVLHESKWFLWGNLVPISLNNVYRGMELGHCLDIVRLLNEDNFENAKLELEKQNHSKTSLKLVYEMVKEFSEKGSKFIKYLK